MALPFRTESLLDTVSAKVRKGLHGQRSERKYLTGIFYMAPAKSGGGKTVCAFAGACVGPCLNYSGRGGLDTSGNMGIRDARESRAVAWWNQRDELVSALDNAVDRIVRMATHWAKHPTKVLRHLGATRLPRGEAYIPCVRLNGTSDVSWEATGIFQRHPEVQFYDYTKSPIRMMAFLRGQMPSNYHLTFSMGGTRDDEIPAILAAGGNVTVVFKDAKPRSWGGAVRVDTPRGSRVIEIPETPCIDGDVDDLRFLDEDEKSERGIRGGCIVALKFKKITDVRRARQVQASMVSGKVPGFVHSPGPRSMLTPISNPALPSQALAARFGCGGYNYGKPIRWE